MTNLHNNFDNCSQLITLLPRLASNIIRSITVSSYCSTSFFFFFLFLLSIHLVLDIPLPTLLPLPAFHQKNYFLTPTEKKKRGFRRETSSGQGRVFPGGLDIHSTSTRRESTQICGNVAELIVLEGSFRRIVCSVQESWPPCCGSAWTLQNMTTKAAWLRAGICNN